VAADERPASQARRALSRAQPVLRVLGQGVFDLGEDPGAANVAKLACNFMLASAMEAMAEAFTLAEKNGIARSRMAEILTQTVFDCPVYRNYGKQIAEQRLRMCLLRKHISGLSAGLAARAPVPLANQPGW
jgi:3-hydroxyisobutyrate dehydrogenase-like beta-hydroxyacid dehydrogenase